MLSTASITSSIYEHERENGRSYHAFHAGKYLMPNDDGEQDRMDSQYSSPRQMGADETNVFSSTLPRRATDVGEQAVPRSHRESVSCVRRWHRHWNLGNGLCRRLPRRSSAWNR